MSKDGFSLIELLVVLGVIIIVTAVTIPNIRQGQDSLALQRATNEVTQDIRRAVEFSIRGEPYAGPRGRNTCSGIGNNVAGYGMRFDTGEPDSYFMFVQCNEVEQVGSEAVVPDGTDFSFSMPDGIVLHSITRGGVGTNSANIYFQPPIPNVYYNGSDEGHLFPIRVVLTTEGSSDSRRTIYINQRGVIGIER